MGKTKPFAKIDVFTGTGQACRSLSWSARWALVAVASQFNGHNNGRLVLTKRRLEPWGFNSDATIAKARRELVKAGILIECKRAIPAARRPAQYALCWEELPQTGNADAFE